ncbi:MAG TPA: tyrosine-type recombinase/integrase [Blastocatellia bacterium]|nr:tyrosine-type recombinase/integrase [Blastocatellia bacterium]
MNIIPISDQQAARRSEATVNAILASVSTLYDYHERTGAVKNIPLFRTSAYPHKRYKSFLHHISKGKPIMRSTLRLRERARLPVTVTREQVQQSIEACYRHRDKFLIALLDETGMRVGQALGLRHEDIISWDNLIHIVPRSDNANGARSKGGKLNTVYVSKELMELYKNYLVYELEDLVNDHVFINLWDGPIGRPMQYSAVAALFHRLSKKTASKVTPHMLRHTHATEMLRACGNLKAVQERLGHSNLQSTEIYLHLVNDDLKQAHQKFLDSKREKAKANE